MKQELLDLIAAQLNENAVNYTVFLQFYEMPFTGAMDAQALIHEAFGANAVIGSKEEVQAEAVFPEVEESLCYAGGDGAGPADAVLRSEMFKKLIAELRGDLTQLVADSGKIERFWLQDGHPAYPVFWDFAFLFQSDEKATIVIGSSSD
ncbi:hypothetical protein ACFOLJ_22530 [Rugamonas sp. CCM 8940]|uniref:hypothetical protein n=1 Tax=Rugamonas sp. CCM 8940 TaxID=2765359 RepID=UPI0018F7A65A|nr:hypothetical protein [Rugamonas sp. CCM 8940]MBJ7314281.1 hypothetical protein [Rugamonas sp. CCM 8940]